MNEGCLGQIPEIVDGDAPHAQCGCDAAGVGRDRGAARVEFAESALRNEMNQLRAWCSCPACEWQGRRILALLPVDRERPGSQRPR